MKNQLNEQIGDDHVGTCEETPLLPTAFDISDEEKIKKIEEKFAEIMEILGLDLSDDSLSGTPHRVAKMYVEEIFSGLKPENKPVIKTFENKYRYGQILVQKDITFYSNCEHHFVPIIGKAHVAYISKGEVVGLSKINRLVNYFAKRPQVQERMTRQIFKELQKDLMTEDVAVVIEATHLCVSSRGVKDTNSKTITSEYGGKFLQERTKREFLEFVNK